MQRVQQNYRFLLDFQLWRLVMYSSVHYRTVCRAVLDLSPPRGEMLSSLSLFRARPLGDGDLGEGVDWPDGPVCWRAGWVNGWTGHELAGGMGR